MNQSTLLTQTCAIEFLKTWLLLQRQKNAHFGTRAACKLLGVGHGTISNILAGRRKLSMGLAVRMAEKMNLDLRAKTHFLLLNTLNEMDSERLQSEIQKRIRSNAEDHFEIWDALFVSLGYGAVDVDQKRLLARSLEEEIHQHWQIRQRSKLQSEALTAAPL